LKKQITGEAKVNYATYRRFSEFQIFRSANPKLKKFTFYGLGIISAVLLFLIGLSQMNNTYLLLGGIILFFLVMSTIMTRQMFAKQCKINGDLLKYTQKYVFAPDGFIFEMDNGETDNRQDIFYSDFYMVYEVKDAFYLYVNKKSAYIVPKNCLKNTTPEQAREFLMSKIPKGKYIIVKQ
jgi:hypothetical protein